MFEKRNPNPVQAGWQSPTKLFDKVIKTKIPATSAL